ncbi:MAG: PH domain-containing protein [Acidobacteria bacterium]|nr:PH domain-containing protein [Candidatus Sulfomarinibacter sp. MAG AM1]
MADGIKGLLLRLMRVPPEPRAPAGSAGSAEVFRASKRYLQLKLISWAGGQVMTLLGLVAALAFLHLVGSGQIEVLDKVPHRAIILRFMGWAEVIGIVGFLVQLPVSLFLVLLDWEMRWYIVTDRSLRIREGVWRVNEMTMTFANVQEVSIRQGPIERLFGISNLRVRTAGGGGRVGPNQPQNEEKSGHIGFFRGVDNAPAIRDLILERLKRLRDAGLGDPDQPQTEAEASIEGMSSSLLDAAHEMLAEARSLRRAVEP